MRTITGFRITGHVEVDTFAGTSLELGRIHDGIMVVVRVHDYGKVEEASVYEKDGRWEYRWITLAEGDFKGASKDSPNPESTIRSESLNPEKADRTDVQER